MSESEVEESLKKDRGDAAPETPDDAANPEGVEGDDAYEPAPMEWVTPDTAVTWRERLLWAGVLLLLTAVAYSPALQGTFVWDDDHYVHENKAMQGSLGDVWSDWKAEPSRRLMGRRVPSVSSTSIPGPRPRRTARTCCRLIPADR